VTNHFFFFFFLKVIIRRRRREEKMISQWDEHLFWLEMLQDHAYFVRDALSPRDSVLLRTETAGTFQELFLNKPSFM
jgi:hypothetical protein